MSRSTRIDGQNQAYRRGLVMGLTMAEVGILIIFVLLLLISWRALRHARELGTRPEVQVVPSTELAGLRDSEKRLRAIAQSVGLGPEATPTEISELVRSVQQATQTEAGASALKEASEALMELQATRDELRKVLDGIRGPGSEALAEQLEAQSFEMGVKEGQLRVAQTRLASLGGGSGERPCWVEPDGTVMFLYDVLLKSEGIQMRERAGIEAVRERFPLPSIDPKATLTEDEFLRVTRPLYDYGRSDERQCRFHAWIYDGTAVDEKALYKQLTRTVEGHFYRQYNVSDGPSF